MKTVGPVASALFLVLILGPDPAFSATRHVPAEHSTIQACLNAALPGDLCLVEPGTYVETVDFLGKGIVLRSEVGPEVTIIDGNQDGSVVTFDSGETPDAVLEGFTLRNGSGTYKTWDHDYYGGGIFCHGTSPTIRNCRIVDNACERGAGIMENDASPTISNCTFAGNQADWGGAFYTYRSSSTMVNCTIFDNVADLGGGGVACYLSDPTLTNCVVWGNASPLGPDIGIAGVATLVVSYSAVLGGEPAVYAEPMSTLVWGPGNIDEDPLFVGDRDLRLPPGSPCIDAGDPATAFDDACIPPLPGDRSQRHGSLWRSRGVRLVPRGGLRR